MASESGGWLNHARVILGRGCVCGVVGAFVVGLPACWGWLLLKVKGLEWSAGVGESPVAVRQQSPLGVSRVVRDSWNAVRIWRDHPLSLNTSGDR